MIKSQNVGNESGYSSLFALAAAAITVCSSLVIGAAALAPAVAGYSTTTYAISGNGPTGYFPDQFVNQAREIEAMPDTDGDIGLATRFPEEVPAANVDSTPEMYS
jgi:hypothetical protein